MPRIEDVLSNLSTPDPEASELLSKLRLFLQKRFWHEFGETLLTLIYSKPNFGAQALIEAAVADLNTYLDPFFIVELLDVQISRTDSPLSAKLEKIERGRELVAKNELAVSYLEILAAKARFVGGDFEQGLQTLKEVEGRVERHRAVPRAIFAALGQAKLILHWRKGDFPQFYNSVIKFLAYCEERKMTPGEKLDLAEKTFLAALLSDQILTFGDILSNNFFKILAEDPEKRFLWQLVEIFNRGNVDQLEQFLASQSNSIAQNPQLAQQTDKLRRKIRVIALYDSVFFSQKGFAQQNFSFQEIASIAKIEKREVEKLIVHVLSIGLLRGFADEVEEVFFVTGLKAQDLDVPRLSQLREKFENWGENIKATIDFVNKC